MANQYPPTRDQYVASVRRQSGNLGAALGMAGAVFLVSTAGIPINYLAMMTAPFALFVGAAVGMGVMALAGATYASATYQRRYRKEFEQARELAAALAEDPLMMPSTPLQQALTSPPPADNRRWSSLTAVPPESYAQLRADEKLVAQWERSHR